MTDSVSDDSSGEITKLLHRWADGSTDAENELFRLVLPDLRRIAHHLMRGERRGHTFQATELIDQIYDRLVAARDRDWRDRRHFFAIAARAMRWYLIDHARGRPKAEFVPLDEIEGILGSGGPRSDLALAVDGILNDLQSSQPALCAVVEMKFFLGLTDAEAAEAMGLKLRTFQRMWHDARRSIFEKLPPELCPKLKQMTIS